MNRLRNKNNSLIKSSGLLLVPLYKKFFRFLDMLKKGEDAWPAYWRYYYFPHRKFFDSYFSLFPLLDRQALRIRVESIRPDHYIRLRSLLKNNSAEKIIKIIHQRCFKWAQPKKTNLIKVYLIVGFFSPEAFILSLGEEKVIVFGLERFRDLSSLDLFYAHEYAHFLLQESSLEIPEKKKSAWYLIAEGIACWFSSLMLPERPLTDHLFLRRDRLNWCLQNESLLKSIFKSNSGDFEKIMKLEQYGDQSLNLPARTLHFLGYRAIEAYLKHHEPANLLELIRQPEKLLSMNLSTYSDDKN